MYPNPQIDAGATLNAMSGPSIDRSDGFQRIRLSDWARRQGIARVTAYRMLRRGLLPVPSEKSPTGRWYVLIPPDRPGRFAFYTRAAPGPEQAFDINRQIESLTQWAALQRRRPFVVAREIGHPFSQPLRKLASLLADSEISDIVVDTVDVVGATQFSLLIAALAPQGRSIIVANPRAASSAARRREARAALLALR